MTNYGSQFQPNWQQPGFPPQASLPAQQPSGPSSKARSATALRYSIGFLVIIWAVHIVNMLLRGALVAFGVQPLDLSSIWHIFTSPLIHGSISHIMSNSVPGAIFVFLVALSGRKAFWEVTLIAGLIGGIGTWFFGGVGTSHVGASGLIYGWLAYLIVRGVFNRSFSQFALGIVLAFAYGGLIYGVLPNEAGVSWQGHLFGGIGGLVAGAVITSDDPPALVEKRRQRQIRR
ncbi:rhomboid family intramembrane serine protease [Staphylococcus chromogenes]|nr:rhomboid family intramembrane serine protease [Staphylococcus chromogenes]